jgi:hypothetical protein
MLRFSDGEGPSIVLRLKSRQKLEQQESEFYLQRCEREGCMGACSGTRKPVVPQVGLDVRFYSF